MFGENYWWKKVDWNRRIGEQGKLRTKKGWGQVNSKTGNLACEIEGIKKREKTEQEDSIQVSEYVLQWQKKKHIALHKYLYPLLIHGTSTDRCILCWNYEKNPALYEIHVWKKKH